MNASGRYPSFVSDIAIMYGMYSSILCPVSSNAIAAHTVDSYSQELAPKHFEFTLCFVVPNAAADSVPSRT